MLPGQMSPWQLEYHSYHYFCCGWVVGWVVGELESNAKHSCQLSCSWSCSWAWQHIESDWHNLSQFVFVWQHGTWFYYHVAPSDYLACVQFCIVKLLNVSILHKTPSCLSFNTSIYVRFQTPINFSFDLRYLCQFVFFTGQSPSPSIHCRQLQTKYPDLGQF